MTSKADEPPSYEEALRHPKEDPNHGGLGPSFPPPPCYTPGPAAFSGPPGFGGPAGMWAAPGFPPGMPIAVSTLSPGPPAITAGSAGSAENEQSWSWNTSLRHTFIRKVYLMVAAQLTVTTAIVAVFTFVDPVRELVLKYPGVYWASLVVYFVVYCVLVCCKETRRRFPWNLVLLGVYTLSLSFMTGTISSYYETKAVFIAMAITMMVCVSVTVFCFQTKVDFTSCTGLLCITSFSLVIVASVAAVALAFKYVPWVHMLYAAIGAIIYTLFLVHNTQLLIGNRQLAISPEEHVYGALFLYIDVVNIFLFILQFSGAAAE